MGGGIQRGLMVVVLRCSVSIEWSVCSLADFLFLGSMLLGCFFPVVRRLYKAAWLWSWGLFPATVP